MADATRPADPRPGRGRRAQRCSGRSSLLLRKKGYEVVGLDSPIAATQQLAQEDFDVAMLDIKMPQLSGLELLNAVKHRRPEVEVIMMTGHATVETALAAVKAGAYDYLTKPFERRGAVARAVAKAAERKRSATATGSWRAPCARREGVPARGWWATPARCARSPG